MLRSVAALLTLIVLLCASPVLGARASAATVHSDHLSATVATTPRLLEPGPIEFAITVTKDGQPLRNEPVYVSFASAHKTYFASTLVTDTEGVAHVAMYLDEGGKPILSIDAAGEHLSTPILVKGRGILVAGLLTALAVLVVLLVDRP